MRRLPSSLPCHVTRNLPPTPSSPAPLLPLPAAWSLSTTYRPVWAHQAVRTCWSSAAARIARGRRTLIPSGQQRRAAPARRRLAGRPQRPWGGGGGGGRGRPTEFLAAPKKPKKTLKGAPRSRRRSGDLQINASFPLQSAALPTAPTRDSSIISFYALYRIVNASDGDIQPPPFLQCPVLLEVESVA